ncbi:hypothetical protein C1645_877579 [Glomus cerebriforme]|uniref:F-box domain-containing protein n=1 Tax=Glomus cerebriforme TaxID=658196 RepID=A0A397SZE9_9GLOM|nr:hypothetical protein C1645_877579 [Glomus cerebriforme]
MKRPLPSLCLEKIFWEIYNEDIISDKPIKTILDIRNTLFNCLLVNRDFCRHVIPILWRNTFNKYLPSDKLVMSYLCFLSPEERFSLSQRLNINISGLLDSFGKKRPFFNYSSYLRELEYHGVFKSVQELWPKESKEERNQQNIDYQLILVGELFKMFLSQCPTLHKLDLTTSTDLNFINPFKFIPIPSTNSCLIKLKEFNCSEHPDQLKIFNTLSNICHNIEVMKLRGFYHNFNSPILYEAIGKFIRCQKYLKKFICYFAKKGFMSIIGNSFPISLQEITLHACDFLEEDDPFISFVNYYNLSSLTLIDCKNLQGSHFSPLRNLKLNIIYTNDPLQYFDIKSIITHSNIILTKLLLNDVIQPCSFIEHISTYCPNLTHLKAYISARILPQIPLLFKSLKKLEVIDLHNETTHYENLIPLTISNEMAIEISKSIPNSLYSFTFLLMVVFTRTSLSLFLEHLDERCINMRDTFNDYDYNDDEYIDIEMNQVIFGKFYVRYDLEEWMKIRENELYKLFREFECTKYLDDKSSYLIPTYIEEIDE